MLDFSVGGQPDVTQKLPTPETHVETGSVHPKRSQKATAKMLILLFYVLKRCFLGLLWVDRPSLSVSFRSGQCCSLLIAHYVHAREACVMG